jgi:hypothetical protein
MECYYLVNKLIFINIKKLFCIFLLGNKSPNNNSGNCIVTVLDANDLPSLNSNTSAVAGDSSIDPPSLPLLTTNRNQHLENNRNSQNVLHRFLIFHRSDQSQI